MERDRNLSSENLFVNENEDSTLTRYGVLKRRWYILSAFSFLACFQCLIWSTFGPIDVAILYAYPDTWSDATVAAMANWGTLAFVLLFFPLSMVMEKLGIRVAVLLATFLVGAGTILRAAFSGIEYGFLITSHLCAILNGAAGVAIMSAPPAISAVWFPPSERAQATAISQIANQLGNGFSYFLGPALVPYDPNNETLTEQTYGNSSDVPSMESVRTDIQWYMIGLGIVAGMILILIVSYFPEKPSISPSPSSTIVRTDFRSGITRMLTNRNVILCGLAYAIPGGVNGAYAAVLTINLKNLGMDDTEAGNIGAIGVFGSAIAGYLSARITDTVLGRKMKLTLTLMLISTILLNTWLTLLCLRIISFQRWQIYASVILGMSLNFACTPIFFEYAVEMAFPVSEGMVGTFMALLNNLVAMIFLCLFFFHIKSTVWMNYCLALAPTVALPLLWATQESYNRGIVDEEESHSPSQNHQESHHAIDQSC